MALITPLSTFPSKNDAGQATIAVGKVQLSVANSGTNTLDLLLLKKGDGGYFSVVGVLTAAPSPNGKATEFIADNYESADYSVVLPNGSGTNLIVYLDGIATGGSLPSGAATADKQDTGNTSLASIDSKFPSKGQTTMSASVPVAIASNQTAVPISAASLPLPSGAATAVTQGSTTSGQSGTLAMGAVTTAAPTYTTAQTSPLSLTTAGALRVNAAQLPTALGATTKAASLSIAPATDSVGTAGSASSTVYSVQGLASMTAVQVTPPAGIGQQTLAHSLSVGLNNNQVGTAGSPSTTVVSVQGVTSGTNLPVSQATAANLKAQVFGGATIGSAPSGNPVLIAGSDGSFVWNILVDGAGSIRNNPASTGVANTSIVAGSSSSGTLLASNTSRRGVSLSNNSSAILYLLFSSGTASASANNVIIPPNTSWFMPQPIYTGQINCIWASAAGQAYIVELT